MTVKDGVQIEKDVANNKYSLTIPKANPAVHSGVVTVKASNTIGTAQHDINLSILGNYLFAVLNSHIDLILRLNYFSRCPKTCF